MPRPTPHAITRRAALAGAAAAGIAGLAPAAAGAASPEADPDLVMIIRHGEKPPAHGAPYGITAAGDRDADALTTEGWARAGALVTLFAPRRGSVPAGLARPGAVYASRPDHGHNLRESETVGLVARELGVPVHAPFDVGEEAQLAAALRRVSGPVLVAWEHKHIPAIVARFPLTRTISVPAHWPGDRFDMVWTLRPTATGGYTFAQVPELLLPGDSPRPIA